MALSEYRGRMKRKLFFSIIITSIALFIFSGCQFQAPISVTPTSIIPKLVNKTPHVRGFIKEILKKDGKVSGVFIVGTKDPDIRYDQAIVGITDKTVIYLKENSDYKVINPEALSVGENAAILFVGPISESNPVQAYADEILVLP